MKKKNTDIQDRHIVNDARIKTYEAMQRMRDRTATENFHRRPYCAGRR